MEGVRMDIYKWRGMTVQIADKDLGQFPGAVPVHEKKQPEPKVKKQTAKNKSRKKPENK